MAYITQFQVGSTVFDVKDAKAALATDLENTKNDISDFEKHIQSGGWLKMTPEWKNGAYNDSTGAFIELNTRVVSKKFRIYKGSSVEVTVPTGFSFKVCRWNKNGGFISTGGWLGSGSGFYADDEYIISIMATNDSAVNPSSFSGAIAIDDKTYRNTVVMGSVNRNDGYIPVGTVKNGVAVELKNGVFKIEGKATESTYWDVINNLNGFPAGVAPGEDYYLSYQHNHSTYTYLTVYFNYGNGWSKYADWIVGVRKISIPSNAVGMLVRLYVQPNYTFPKTIIHFTLSEQMSNRDLLKKINSSGGGSSEGNSMEVRFLGERGTGDCTIIKYADGTVFVIDFGYPDSAFQIVENNWREAISELDIDHIDYAVISHYHSDHCGILTEGVADDLLDVSTTFFLPKPFTSAQLTGIQAYDAAAGDGVYNTYNASISKINEQGCAKVYPEEGEKFTIGGSVVEFWNTNHTPYLDRIVAGTLLDYNPCSICNYITMGTVRMCFTGDISNEVMEDYIDNVLPSQIFKVNHHCTGYPAVQKFMDGLMPEIAVTMCGNTLVSTLASGGQHKWFEDNFVPNIPTGYNKKTLSMLVTSGGYIWNTPCSKYIIPVES